MAATYTVAGLSGANAGYNGDYTESGTQDGYPAYTLDASHWLYFVVVPSNKWALGPTKGSLSFISRGGNTTDPLTTSGAWSAALPPATGTPVVTAIAGGTTWYGNMACDTLADFQGVGTVIGPTKYGDMAADTVASFEGQGYGIFIGIISCDTVAGFDAVGTKYNANDRGANLTDDTWDDIGDTTAYMEVATDTYGYFVRFPVTVAAEASILTATLTLEAALSQTGSASLRITLLDYDDCGQFTDVNFAVPSDIALSATYLAWNPDAWTADTRYEVDVKTLVQAFIDRVGYASGQHVGLLIAGGE